MHSNYLANYLQVNNIICNFHTVIFFVCNFFETVESFDGQRVSKEESGTGQGGF